MFFEYYQVLFGEEVIGDFMHFAFRVESVIFAGYFEELVFADFCFDAFLLVSNLFEVCELLGVKFNSLLY
jgi:hypothetical protein